MSNVAPEDVARQIITIFTDGFSTSLATVAAARDATEEVTLTDFVTRKISSDPETLEKTWQYPALIVATGDLQGLEGGYELGYSLYGLETRIYKYLKNPDSRTLQILRWRYAEAALELLGQHPKLDLAADGGIVPSSIAQLPSNVIQGDGSSLVGGVVTRFVFKLGNYGF